MLHRLAGLVDTLVVFPERMRENLEMTRGLAFSGTLLLALSAASQTREDAYARVQKHAMDTWDHGGDFRERILADPEIARVLAKEEIERAFSLEEALRHVDAIFERTLALAETEEESS
jgi:adenylosuccinate lyase